MRVYPDNCCYNRPFDDQTQLKVRLETEAKLYVQGLMRTGAVEYVWSDWFLTTDNGILKKVRQHGLTRVANPVEFAVEVQNANQRT